MGESDIPWITVGVTPTVEFSITSRIIGVLNRRERTCKGSKVTKSPTFSDGGNIVQLAGIKFREMHSIALEAGIGHIGNSRDPRPKVPDKNGQQGGSTS